jgi:hypothetical protein
MIYMVEMEFRNTEREHDWHTWYLGHVTSLICNVPGFRASQRFRALTPAPAPWMALHDVVSPDIFQSKEYKAHGGPASTGEWQKQHTNWTRNAYAGIDNTPDVPLDAHLLVIDANVQLPAPLAAKVTWLETVGLDRTTGKRGIVIVPPGQLTAKLFHTPGVHIYKPISPRVGE